MKTGIIKESLFCSSASFQACVGMGWSAALHSCLHTHRPIILACLATDCSTTLHLWFHLPLQTQSVSHTQ